MTILKSEIRNKFSTIPNSVIRNKDVSDGDYRLMIYLYSLPNGWKVNQSYLATELRCNLRNINAKIKRLKEAGYLEIIRANKDNMSDYIYVLKEKGTSVNNTSVDNASVNNALVNDVHINNNIINTELIKKDINSIDKTKKPLGKPTKNLMDNHMENENINNKYFDNDEINELFKDFLDLRKKIKAVNSDRAINNLINKLNKYDDDIKKQMINNSITNSWKDVYEIKKSIDKKKEVLYEQI